MAQGLAPRARRALPRGVHHLHGALGRDRRDDHARGRQDHPRVARGDGRVHGRPLPSCLRGRACATPARCSPRRRSARTPSGSSSRRSRSASWRRSRPGTSPSTSPGSRSSTASPWAALRSGSRPSTRRSAPTCSPRSSTTPASPPGRSTSSTAAATSARTSCAIPTSARSSSPGSTHTGEQVARDAALKNRVLELGGNGPQIVLADANIEKAADAAIVGCFYLAGQCCTAAERILVHESVKDEFVEALTERTKALRVGDPLDEATDMGPMCTPEVLTRTQEHLRGRDRQGRDDRPRRRPRGPVPRADDRRRRHERHADRAGGDLRPGRARSSRSRRSTRRSRSPTRPSTA